MRVFFLTFAMLVTLSGCASDWQKSFDRWNRLSSDIPNGEFLEWTTCIDRNSRRDERPMTAEEQAASEANWAKIKNDPEKWGSDASAFAAVLNSCREHMTGPAWRALSNKQVRHLLDDAWQHYLNVQTEQNAADEAGII